MIVQTYYLSISQDDRDSFDEAYKVKLIDEIVVPKHGKFLNRLEIDDDILITLMTTPTSTIIEDRDSVTVTNTMISNIQALTPSMIDTIIASDKEDVYANNAILLKWAFEHKFKSTLIYYFRKHKTMRKYIDALIYQNLDRPNYSDMIIFLLERYDYDISKNNNRLFDQAALSKNYKIVEYLLREKDAAIPSNIYNIYKKVGSRRYTQIWDLFKEYADRVEMV